MNTRISTFTSYPSLPRHPRHCRCLPTHRRRCHTHRFRSSVQPVLAGDKVLCEMTPYDLTKGRITYRFK